MNIGTDPETRRELRQAPGWSIAVGILMIVLGLVATAVPLLATIAATLLFGWLFLFGGIFRCVYAFGNRKAGQFFLKLLVGILYILAGLVLLGNPLEGVLTLTLVLGIAIFVQGAIQTFLAFQLRPSPSWGWVLFSGVLSVILGIFIWSE